MKIIINKQNLAPIFDNVITQKIKIDTKNQIIKKDNNQKNNLITLISEKTKLLTFKKVFDKKILFVRLYDKQLYLFLSKITNKNKGILEPKSKENNNKNIIKNSNKKINLIQKQKKTNPLSQYGNGIIKMLTPISSKKNLINTQSNLKIAAENKDKAKEGKALNTRIKQIYTTKLSKYIKAISIFNSEIAKSQNILYQFNKSNKISSIYVNSNLYSILYTSFLAMSALISKPVFVITPNKVIIQLFFYLFKNNYNKKNKFSNQIPKFLDLNKNNNKLQLLSLQLSKYFKKPIELELDRLYYPYFDSNILANLIGLLSNVMKFRNIMHKVSSVARLKNPLSVSLKLKNRSSLIPSFLSGLKIRLAGRLASQRVIPRLTVKNVQRGTLARGKTNLVSKERFTSKNRRGAYSITVTMGHVFF
jgi:hypothetical protein